jgi:hypothetical protein
MARVTGSLSSFLTSLLDAQSPSAIRFFFTFDGRGMMTGGRESGGEAGVVYMISPAQSISQKICHGKTVMFEDSFLGAGSREMIRLFLHFCSFLERGGSPLFCFQHLQRP